MPIAIAVFAVVLGIVLGAYWLLIVRPESGERETIQKRLRQPRKIRLLAKLEKDPEKLSAVGSVDTVLARLDSFSTPLQRLILQSGLQWTVGALVLGSIALGFATAAVLTFVLPSALAALALGALVAVFPFLYVKRKAAKRLLVFEEQFPEAIDLLARALRAGHAITTGLAMVAEELPDPIGPEFQTLYDQQNFGLPLSQALKNFADRVVILDARFFVTAVLTQKESGGNLSEVLDNLGSIIRERFKVKRQVRVISAHGRMTGWVLSAIPVSLGLFFAISNPEKYASFYRDPLGMQLIGGALCLQLIGVFIMKKIVNIEY